jgi:hypothetical protein
MRTMMALMLVPALVLAANPRKVHRSGLVSTAKDAKAIAEQDTSGIAVSARRVQLNGASGGWEVDVHMPKEERGWRCIIDNDARSVFRKERIPNPKPPHARS